MGLIVDVFRGASRGDCSNGGVSAHFNRVCVVNIDGPFEPKADAPAVVLIEGPSVGGKKNPILVPEHLVDSGEWYMFGGNFGYSSDSRFGEAVERMVPGFTGAVKFHDRVEAVEDNLYDKRTEAA